MDGQQDYYQESGENIGYGNPQFVKFGEGVSDDDLIRTINTWVNESVPFHDAMLTYQNRAVRYYLGDQTSRGDVPGFNSDTVYNRIFEGTETIVPIVTGTAHQFIAIPGEDNERSMIRAQKLQKVLSYKYEELEIQRKLENITRDIILKRFGVIKWFWNPSTNDIDCKVVDPRLILVPKIRMDINDNDFPYNIEIQDYTREDMKAFFPDADLTKLVFGRRPEVASTPTPMSQFEAPTYQVLECTTNEYKVWKQGTTVLKKMINPYFDFEGEETETKITKENGKVKTNKFRVFYNHLPYPVKEYIFFNPFVTGDAPVSETSMAEIVMPIQDEINTQKRQIINNLVKMGNGQIYIDSDAIPKELADQITSEPGLVIEGKNLASENRIRRVEGTPLPQAHFENLVQSITAFDNVFGTHGSTRGAGGSSTLGGQIIDRQQDVSRIEQITRCLNRGVARLADGFVQMMRMYYDESHVIKILGADGTVEFLKFNQNDIDPNVVIDVKSGTPPSLDPVGRYNQAIQLWQLGAIDPVTLFERLEFANPQDAAKKLAAWKQGQLVQESDIRQKEAAAGIAAKAAATPPAGGTGRNVETPGNVIQRATSAISGGGAAPLTNTPNGANKYAVA